jgi:uncharacterized membrane protein
MLRAAGSEDTSMSDRWALTSAMVVVVGFLVGLAFALWIAHRSRGLVAVAAIATASVAVFGMAQLIWSYQQRSDPDRCPPPQLGETVSVELGGWATPDYCVYSDVNGTGSGRDSVLAR